ncbi:MAG: hypothetical protein Fur009_2730 [Candidatus Microgenomates bacterium]
MKIINLNTKYTKFSDVNKLVIDVLKKGGLVIYPSDTVYGALVDATNEEAVRKLIDFKNRPPGKAISVFVSGWQMINDLVEVNENQKKILKEILPGCFTVVLKSKGKVVDLLESEKKTLGIRYILYQPIIDLVSKFKKPITATSANLGGKSPHYSIDSLLKQLPDYKKDLIDLIINAGKLPRNKPSTVIDLTTPEIKILRHGDMNFYQRQEYISNSPDETKKIAQKIIMENIEKVEKKPLVFILQGNLGVGKTIFVKGVGELFGITEIVSPTFVVLYEYDIKKCKNQKSKCKMVIKNKKLKKIIHIDLYNVEEKEEFKYLGIDDYLKPGNILTIEWGEKSGEIYDKLREKGKIVLVKIEYEDKRKRKLIINK